jgi:hypothetical protein
MARLGRFWRAYFGLSRAHRRVLVQAWLLLPLTATGLRLLGFRWAQSVAHPAECAEDRRHDLTEAQAVARLVGVAARRSPLHATCLARSLVLCRLLRRQGLAADLRIGVGKPDGRFSAHAWVEHGGVAVNDSEDVERRFVAFDGPVLSGGINAP